MLFLINSTFQPNSIFQPNAAFYSIVFSVLSVLLHFPSLSTDIVRKFSVAFVILKDLFAYSTYVLHHSLRK